MGARLQGYPCCCCNGRYWSRDDPCRYELCSSSCIEYSYGVHRSEFARRGLAVEICSSPLSVPQTNGEEGGEGEMRVRDRDASEMD